MGMYCSIRALSPAQLEQLDLAEDVAAAHERSGPSAHLEKSWHGLHYLLTGSAMAGDMPLAFLLLGGEPAGEDADEGPRFIQPEEVRQINTALSPISTEQLWSRFDPARMEEEGVYPGIWDEPEDDLREEYVGYFQELKRVVAQAAAAGQGLLVDIG